MKTYNYFLKKEPIYIVYSLSVIGFLFLRLSNVLFEISFFDKLNIIDKPTLLFLYELKYSSLFFLLILSFQYVSLKLSTKVHRLIIPGLAMIAVNIIDLYFTKTQFINWIMITFIKIFQYGIILGILIYFYDLKTKLKNEKFKLCLDLPSGKIFISPYKIYYLKATGNYVNIYYLDNHRLKEILIRSTLKEIYSSLGSYQKHFLDVHRSYLVNKDHINSFNKKDLKIYIIVNKEKLTVPVSRLKSKDIEEKLHILHHSDILSLVNT